MKVEISKVTSGLGFGAGTISHKDRTDVDAQTLQAVEAAITSQDIVVPVDTDKSGSMLDDDGCGDGRGVNRVLEGDKEHTKSLNRAKVFGGGPAMVAATIIGLDKTQNKPLTDVFTTAISLLKSKFTGFGGHTDTHASGDASGCGAIDKAPAVIANAVTYHQEIAATIQALGVDIDGLDQIFAGYKNYAAQLQNQPYAGQAVMKQVVESGKVVKELADDHREMYIVLNTAYGYTVNQKLIREVSGGKVQVFAVDLWRLQELVRKLYAIDLTSLEEAQEQMHQTQQTAFLSELVYTLAVAATLTKGDLPVYAVSTVAEPIDAVVSPVAA